MNKRKPGGYILVMKVLHHCSIQVGRLGLMKVRPGKYLYGGSARRGLEARINRHFRRAKTRYWHIDYLTLHSEIAVLEAWCYAGEYEVEHMLAGHASLEAGEILKGFGAGDCTEKCYSHLWKQNGTIEARDFSADYRIVKNSS